ncbi:tyrosine-type recombinase/integrase [Chloroflexota bacterium]
MIISQQISHHFTQWTPMGACNLHTFRRTFASNLHRGGLDVEHIMRLGGGESLDMVLRYTRSVTFQDSLRFYNAPLG